MSFPVSLFPQNILPAFQKSLQPPNCPPPPSNPHLPPPNHAQASKTQSQPPPHASPRHRLVAKRRTRPGIYPPAATPVLKSTLDVSPSTEQGERARTEQTLISGRRTPSLGPVSKSWTRSLGLARTRALGRGDVRTLGPRTGWQRGTLGGAESHDWGFGSASLVARRRGEEAADGVGFFHASHLGGRRGAAGERSRGLPLGRGRAGGAVLVLWEGARA